MFRNSVQILLFVTSLFVLVGCKDKEATTVIPQTDEVEAAERNAKESAMAEKGYGTDT